jgi:hypothetical protein
MPIKNNKRDEIMQLKIIKGFEDYMISDCGKVFSNKATHRRSVMHEMKLTVNSCGYLIVGLTDRNKKRYTKLVHRLVAEAFISNPENKPQVNHIDGDKTNNHVSNLEWNTAQENIVHAFENGLICAAKGEDNSSAKISNKDAEKLIQMILDGATNEEIALKFGLHERYVSLIRHKKRWKHLWDEKFADKKTNFSHKFDFGYNREDMIRLAFFSNESNANIARKFKVDPSIISKLRNKPLTRTDRIIFEKLNTNMRNDYRKQNNTNRYWEKQVEYISSEMEKVGNSH